MHLLLFVLLPLSVMAAPAKKLYWFIPDGMRADRGSFNIYQWAQEGKLPHLKKMMEEGAYGYSIPDFPSHTPTNFASLLTGTIPAKHGIADGPMHVEGAPLAHPSAAGFSSVTKLVPPFWQELEESGKKVVLVSVPGTTPPALKNGITVRGRWGGWGADFTSVIFESETKLPERKAAGKAFRLFFLGTPLTAFAPVGAPRDWPSPPTSHSVPIEATLESQGIKLFAYVSDSSNDKRKNYDRISFAFDNKKAFSTLAQGEWSDWTPVTLDYKGAKLQSAVRLKVIKLWPNGEFRVRLLINALNRLMASPAQTADLLARELGPMVDFADNWPHQLIYEKEDKNTFLEEARMSLEWHRDLVPVITKAYAPDIFVHDIYTPNLMLESRWWHAKIAPGSSASPKEKQLAWKELLELYQGLDNILGETMKQAGENTLVVLSSDHGVCHLRRLVKLNHLFAKKGWLKYTVDPKTGESKIDWDNTKVVYMKMANIYVNPKGLGGNWKRGNGREHAKLVRAVIKELKNLRDSDGAKPVRQALPWKEAAKTYKLPETRIGDIVIEAKLGYFWHEELDRSGAIFVDPLTSGYKQSIDAAKNECMWTPFVIWGPGVKHGYEIERPIRHIDQVPTFLRLMDLPVPPYMDGKPLEQIFQSRQ